MSNQAAQETTYRPEQALTRQRVQFGRVMAAVGAALTVAGLITLYINYDSLQPQNIALTAGAVMVAVVVWWLLARERVQVAAALLAALFVAIVLAQSATSLRLIAGSLALLTAAVLASRTVYWLTNLAVFGVFAVSLVNLLLEFGFTVRPEGNELVSAIITLALITVIVRYFVAGIERTAQAAARTSALLGAVAEIGQSTSRLLSPDVLFERAVTLIRDRFGFYHVQVFLVDDSRDYATLTASTGEVGRRLLARGHRLRVGSRSVIGRVTESGEPVVARDTDRDRIHAVNELLPDTRSELALPLIDGDRIIGALDVQSTRRDAFDAVDLEALQVMAAQLSTAIRNARLFESQQRALEENKRLYVAGEAERREIQRLNSQLTRSVWDEYMRERRDLDGVTVMRDAVSLRAEWSPHMVEAGDTRQPVSRVIDGRRVIAVPIVLRGQVLGAIELEADDAAQADRLDTLISVAQRLATTLDNIRLYEEAQMATLQEQRINTVVSNFQTAESIEDLLKISLAELSRTLNAEQGMIRLGIAAADRQPAAPPSPSSNGSSSHD